MTYSVIDSVLGNQQIALQGLPDTTPRQQPGLLVTAEHNYWGPIEVIYARAAGAIRMGGLCVIAATLTATGYRFDASENPAASVNSGNPVAVAMTPMTTGQFGWFAVSGLVPVNSTASVAAGSPFGTNAAGPGQISANAAGRQVVNARATAPATTTVVKQATAQNNQFRLSVTGDDGWFIGAYLSGTNIAAGTTIVDIDPSGTQVTLSAATTGVVSGPVTATYNNGTVFYNIIALNRPFLQGAVT